MSDAHLAPLFSWRGQIVSPDSGLTATERHVALTLSLHMNERGGSCFPSIRTLSKETGRSTSTVQSALHSLVAEGWLAKQPGDRKTSNHYTACVPDGVALTDTPTENEGVALTDTGRGDQRHSVCRPPPHRSSTNSSPRSKNRTPSGPDAQQLVAFAVDTARERGVKLPKRTVGQFAQAIKEALAEATADEVKAGVVRMLDRRIMQPSLLPNFIAEAKLPPPKARGRNTDLLDFLDKEARGDA